MRLPKIDCHTDLVGMRSQCPGRCKEKPEPTIDGVGLLLHLLVEKKGAGHFSNVAGSHCFNHDLIDFFELAFLYLLYILRRKVMTNLDSIFKSRDVTLPTKVCLVKAMVFPVVMYGCESWTVKKAEHRRIDAFELWCWRRFLRVRWTARRSNQSILKEISPGISLEGRMLKLKLRYFGHLMQRVDSLEKTLILGGIGGRWKRGRQRMRRLDGVTDLMDMGLSKLQEIVKDRKPGVL